MANYFPLVDVAVSGLTLQTEKGQTNAKTKNNNYNDHNNNKRSSEYEKW